MRALTRNLGRVPSARLGLAWLLAALALVAACAKPVGVEHVDAQQVHRHLTRNVLTSGQPSAPSQQLLHRLDLRGRYAKQPEAALAELRRYLVETRNPQAFFALAELCFLHADRSGEASYHLAAAVYAYAFLFPDERRARPRRLDPRLRLAADLYNRGLTAGLAGPDGLEVHLEPRQLSLPFGQLEFEARPGDFEWGGHRLMRFHPLADLEVHGLSNRYRRPGLGAPLVADLERAATDAPGSARYARIPGDMRIPVTALLRLQQPRKQVLEEQLRGVLRVYTPEDVQSVDVGGDDTPLKYEATSWLAAALHDAEFAGSDLSGFFGRARIFGGRGDGLFTLQPYSTGRVPVVLVHGTASSPGWWAELLNELGHDPVLLDRYQAWLFRYDTGNPILYSARLLRKALANAVAEFDPSGRDPALRQMVLIGHSQGGLLVKLCVVDSGARFYDQFSDVPFKELELSPESRKLLREQLFFEPLPFVKRVIFMATPHRGSYLATPGLGDMLAGLISLPVDLLTLPVELLQQDPHSRLARQLEQMPSSIHSMTPGNPQLEELAAMPVAEGVAAHSIIAVHGNGPPEAGDDGVVKYRSAHLDDVESELIVRSGHSVQDHPLAIGEVERILREHRGQGRQLPAAASAP